MPGLVVVPVVFALVVIGSGRVALAVVAVALVAWPLTTGVALLALGLAGVVTATVTRDRARRARAQLDRPPLRIRATVGRITSGSHP